MDMMQIRRAVVQGEPHPVTVSGNHVTFETDMVGLLQISGSGNITICGNNLFDEDYSNIGSSVIYRPIFIGGTPTVTMSTTNGRGSGGGANLFLFAGQVSSGGSTSADGVYSGRNRTVTAIDGYITVGYRNYRGADPREADTMLNVGSSAESYEAYNGTTSATLTGRKSFAGINNVWSDSGNVTVTYWKH